MGLVCHAVVVRSQSVELALPWPHWRGAPPHAERRPDFAPIDDPVHPFRAGEYHRPIDLHGDLDPLELGAVTAEIAVYNDAHVEGDDATPVHDASEIFQRLLDCESIVVGGGLRISLDGHEVLRPACCCGLEGWREWFAFSVGGAAPWCGHDPDPHLARLADDRLELGYPGSLHVVDLADLRAALAAASRDLAAFADRLAAWLTARAPDLGPALAEKLSHDLALRPP